MSRQVRKQKLVMLGRDVAKEGTGDLEFAALLATHNQGVSAITRGTRLRIGPAKGTRVDILCHGILLWTL
jgi:hypothetical protein